MEVGLTRDELERLKKEALEQPKVNGAIKPANATSEECIRQYRKRIGDLVPSIRRDPGKGKRSTVMQMLAYEFQERGLPKAVAMRLVMDSGAVQNKDTGTPEYHANLSVQKAYNRNGAALASKRKPKAAKPRLHVVRESEPEEEHEPHRPGPEPRTIYDAIFQPIPTPDWSVDKTLSDRSFALIAGPAKLGKTYMAIDLGISYATGAKFLNHFNVLKTGQVMYIQADMDPGIMDWRVQHVAASKEVAPRFMHVDKETVRFGGDKIDHFTYYNNRPFDFNSERWLDWLWDECDRIEPELVIFDSLYRMVRGDINKGEDVGVVIQALDELREEFQCATVLVHNNRKASRDPKRRSEASPAEDMFGSSMLLNAYDDGVFISPGGEDSIHVHREGRRVADNYGVELFDGDAGYSPRVLDGKLQEEETPKKKSHHRATARTTRQQELMEFSKSNPGKYTAKELSDRYGMAASTVRQIARTFELDLKAGQRGRPKKAG